MLKYLVALVSVAIAQEVEDGQAFDTLDSIDRFVSFKDTPKPEDKERAITGGGDVKCQVCEVIVLDIVSNLRVTSDEDAILAALEADEIDEKEVENAPNDMWKHVAKKKRGCNRLFKENFLAKGWDITWDVKLTPEQEEMVEKKEDVPIFQKASWAYVKQTGEPRNDTDMNLYTPSREAAHYACENTIAKYRDEIASFVARGMKKLEGGEMKDLVAEACKKKAKCEKRMKREDVNKRSKETEDAFKGRQMKTMELFLAEQKEKKKAEKAAEKQKKKEEKARKKKEKKEAKENTVEL